MDINFEAFPFTGFTYFTNEELERIWMNIYKNSKLPEQITVEKQQENNYTTKIIASKNEDSIGIEILIEEVDIFKDGLLLSKIYCIEQLNNIIYIIKENNKYDLEINHDENLIYNKSKITSIRINSRIDFEDKNFKEYITRENDYIFKDKLKEIKVMEIDKPILSLYFDEIIKDPKTNNKFKIIINENRIKLIEKINDFWNSEDIFYVIMGTDGIGKTTTLLLYSSYVHNDYKVLYLNLKLFFHKTKKEVEDIFCDEIKRIFFVGRTFLTETALNTALKEFKNLKSLILEEIKNNNMVNNMNNIEYMWFLLQAFINKLVNRGGFNSNILIILDQYKCNNIDIKYKGINDTCSLILQNKECCYFYKIRLLIVISINNYDTKKMFLENLSITYFNYKIKNLSNINSNKENDNNEKNKNYELLDIEEFLDNKIERINQIFNSYISKREYKYNPDSLCNLNVSNRSITKKEYLNYNCNCNELIPKGIGKNYLLCIKAFNYSVKYFQLLMILKNENQKEVGESDDEYEKRICQSFCLEMYKKIRNNIFKGYQDILKEKPIIELNDSQMKDLILLRNYIYEGKTFLIDDMENLLNRFPVKYLNICVACFKELEKDDIKFDLYHLFFTYSNVFIKHAINKIINENLKYKTYNDFDRLIFEKNVNDSILKFSFNNQKLIKRNIFSLVGIIDSTKNYVKKLREKEDSEFYKFYELKNLKNINIDGIDDIIIKKNVIDISKNDIFLNQVSKNGRSFDAGLLIKKNRITKSATNDLILIQDTINKIINYNKKEVYINDAMKSKSYLESVYEGLKIDKIYFLFIIPDNYAYIQPTINKLKSLKIYYLYYSLTNQIFFDTNNNIFTDFRIKEADITFPEKNFELIRAISDINLSKYIIKESTKKYLIKRKNTNKTFIDIYNKVSEINFHECIKVIIPNELKKNIIKIFIYNGYIKPEDKINFIPSTNYKGTEIEKLFSNTNNLIIFGYKNNMYFYYYSYFQINDEFKINQLDNFSIKGSNDVKSPKKNLDDFKKIINYPLFYFCFNIIKNHNFSDENYD